MRTFIKYVLNTIITIAIAFVLITGYNPKTQSWEEIKRQTTSNGVTMSGNLEAGKYTKLEFYYYTNHDCMYNKSNITYSVEYDFNTYE